MKMQRIHHCIGSWVPNFSLLSLFIVIVVVFFFFLYHVQGFKLYSVGRKRKVHLFHLPKVQNDL